MALSFTEVTIGRIHPWCKSGLASWFSSPELAVTVYQAHLSAEIKQVEAEGVGVTREAKGRELFVQPLKHFDCSLGFFKAAHVE